jgi:tetratricopeptide (TPR) repeat protein
MLLGRHFLTGRRGDDTTKAISYFQQALRLDPTFALCWAELGRAFSVEAGRGWSDVRAVIPDRETPRCEPSPLNLHSPKGGPCPTRDAFQIAHGWDWIGAEASYQKATRLAPGKLVGSRRCERLDV